MKTKTLLLLSILVYAVSFGQTLSPREYILDQKDQYRWQWYSTMVSASLSNWNLNP
jgi:hypothetical protein